MKVRWELKSLARRNWLFKLFDTVRTVYSNPLYKQTDKMHFLYVFTLQFLYNSTCFERPFGSPSGVHKFTVSAAQYKPR